GAQVRRGPPLVDLVVALRARLGLVRAVEGPARLRVIELGRVAPRPAHEGWRAEAFDVAGSPGLSLVLKAVQALARRDARAQIVVAPEAPARVDAFARA